MKQLEKCSGQGFDSPHLHQKRIRYAHSMQRHKKRDCASDGDAWFRQGKEYRSGQLGNAEAFRIEDIQKLRSGL
jgi:hypothetical protein